MQTLMHSNVTHQDCCEITKNCMYPLVMSTEWWCIPTANEFVVSNKAWYHILSSASCDKVEECYPW